uniref:guanylate cyclase n=1 Tax=Angiostrongylus cantonensis TaxID=6313 RepID=A0A0K0CXW9_ANGCA
MRQLEHDNLNRFFGVSSDGVITYSLWRFCSRGTLQDVITRGSLPMDNVFMESILIDLATGLSFIHDSFIKKHGRLTSLHFTLPFIQLLYLKNIKMTFQVCVVDDRWQTKISYYGLSYLKETDYTSKSDLLWTAPEIIRGEADPLGTQEGDVYSTSYSELFISIAPYQAIRWYFAKAVLRSPKQSQITCPDLVEVSLVQRCWSENPIHRYSIKKVREFLGSLRNGRQQNLMDHVMKTLENYASSLEAQVEERMVELKEEKKKSDILLYRMLPRQIAERLKLGKKVEPESYESVTVFFSDVVGFTTIASKGSPMQVETIGDGYLCVSGLPNRNGLDHIKQICDLSLELIAGLR